MSNWSAFQKQKLSDVILHWSVLKWLLFCKRMHGYIDVSRVYCRSHWFELGLFAALMYSILTHMVSAYLEMLPVGPYLKIVIWVFSLPASAVFYVFLWVWSFVNLFNVILLLFLGSMFPADGPKQLAVVWLSISRGLITPNRKFLREVACWGFDNKHLQVSKMC